MKKEITKWQTVSSTYISRHSFMSVRRDNRTAPGLDNHDFFVLEFPDWANVVAVTEDGMVVLVRQFRHGLEIFNLEIPGGVVDPGENPLDTAARELAEETGYVPEKIQLLSTVSVNPAIQDNWCHLFLATGCRLMQEQALDGTESIEVKLVPLDSLAAMMKNGEIHHSLNCLAINLAMTIFSAG